MGRQQSFTAPGFSFAATGDSLCGQLDKLVLRRHAFGPSVQRRQQINTRTSDGAAPSQRLPTLARHSGAVPVKLLHTTVQRAAQSRLGRSLLRDPLQYRRAVAQRKAAEIDEFLSGAEWWKAGAHVHRILEQLFPAIDSAAIGYLTHRLSAGPEHDVDAARAAFSRGREHNHRECFHDWMAVRYLLVATGHHEVAVLARQNAQALALELASDAKQTRGKVDRARRHEIGLSASIDLGDIDRAQAELRGLRAAGIHRSWLDEVEYLLLLCSPDSQVGKHPDPGMDPAFAELVEGRSVGVVGPAAPRRTRGTRSTNST